LRTAAREPHRRARAKPVDGGADDDIGQRHALGGVDDGRHEAHAVPFSSVTHELFDDRSPVFVITHKAATGRTCWYAIDRRDSAHRASAASAVRAGECR